MLRRRKRTKGPGAVERSSWRFYAVGRTGRVLPAGIAAVTFAETGSGAPRTGSPRKLALDPVEQKLPANDKGSASIALGKLLGERGSRRRAIRRE